MSAVILDGGLSTALEELGVDISGPLWTARSVIANRRELGHAHRLYAQAGAAYVTTASYQCGVEHFEALGLSSSAARSALLDTTSIARDGVRGTDARVAASIGPFGASLADGSEYHGEDQASLAVLKDYHHRKLDVLFASEPDVFAVETQPRADEVQVIANYLKELGSPPAWFSFGFRDEHSTYGGDSLAKVVDAVANYPHLVAIGLNCSAPHLVTTILSHLADLVPDVALIAYPNHGGEWNAVTKKWIRPTSTVFGAGRLKEWRDIGARFIGGCCGTGPADIADLKREIGELDDESGVIHP
jgi:homocysteine S-methyltransferase